MRKLLYSYPDPFSISPLLALLPIVGKTSKLDALTSSLYARYERVTSLQKESVQDGEHRSLDRRYAAEAAMLKQVLDWLEVNPSSASRG